MGELVLCGELRLRRPQSLLDLLGGVGSPRLEPFAEGGGGGWGDEDLHRLRLGVPDRARPLDLDLEDDRAAVGELALDLLAKRPVLVPAVARVLQELAGLDPAIELLRGEEVIVAAVDLALPRRPGRR